MIAQLDMALFRPKVEDSAEHLARLLDFLRNRGWRTAREIEATLGSPYSDRYTRLLAAGSKGKIIGSSQGYKITREATPDEKAEYRGRQISQIKAMSDRLAEVEREWHSGGGMP